MRLSLPITFLVTTLAAGAIVASACSDQGARSQSASSDEAGAASDSGLTVPLEPSPPDEIPPRDRKDAVSSPVVFDALRGGVWTANGDVGTLSYVDVDAQRVVQEVAIGKDVRSIALSPDKKWIAAVDRDGASVTLVDAETREVRRVLPLGTHPRAAVWDADNPRWLYVSVEDDDAVAIVDRTRGVVDHTIAVGRLPSALGVSRLRHELAILHLIDARVTLASLDGAYTPADQGGPNAEVPLANEPAGSDDTVPNGKPFAFDSLAWAPDGNVAWLPHELLANHHPLQFQRNLFPAVSVADLSARAEVLTDPANTNGVVAGRKLLFSAINIPDAVGNTSILSQPCAAAFHPQGIVAYVLACASEDLLTFDATSGVAIDLLRNLPGDHPSGMTLDDTGQRAFVVSDQSHTLLTIDLADGSPVRHARVVAGPLPVIASDPIDPELREAKKLFVRANSSKGSLATTGGNWMSCGGCHLDGLNSTNLFLLEALSPIDPMKDVRIGHLDMKDYFSTAPTPDDPTFDPHDLLVALLDQGGLAPDRTGAIRAGQIDPSKPTADAALMAKRLARIVQRDLPAGPSWLRAAGGAPNLAYDGAWCGQCHQAEYQTWKKSVHAHAAIDPMMLFGRDVEKRLRGAAFTRTCAGCHDPVSLRAGDTSLGSGRGITCLGCHDAARLIRAGGNADYESRAHDWTADHKKAASRDILDRLRKPEFCAACHQAWMSGNGMRGLTTFDQWHQSAYAGGTAAQDAGADAALDAGDAAPPPSPATCIDCHVPNHSMPGGNVYMAQALSDAEMVATVTAKLKSAVTLTAKNAGDGVHVVVHNSGAGHAFPAGVTDIREPWVEVQAIDGASKVLARYGGPDDSGLIPPAAARFGLDIAKQDGTPLYLHEVTEVVRATFMRTVPPLGQVEVVVPIPATLPSATAQLDAVLYYRNVRTLYYRAATGDDKGHAPEVEVARAVVSQK